MHKQPDIIVVKTDTMFAMISFMNFSPLFVHFVSYVFAGIPLRQSKTDKGDRNPFFTMTVFRFFLIAHARGVLSRLSGKIYSLFKFVNKETAEGDVCCHNTFCRNFL